MFPPISHSQRLLLLPTSLWGGFQLLCYFDMFIFIECCRFSQNAPSSSQLSSTAQHRVVPCGAVPFRTVRCGAVPCCAIFCLLFRKHPASCKVLTRYVRTYNHKKAHPAQLISAQRSTPQQHMQLNAAPCGAVRSLPYIPNKVCTCMHAASGLFYWDMELVAFASRLFGPNMYEHLFRYIIPCERA